MTAAVHGPRVTQELLPCPFCGWANSRSIGIWSDGGFWAECPDCFAQGPVEGTEAEAIAAWNARHREASQAELVEALEEARRQLEYIDERSPSGTTPAVLARINAALTKVRTDATGEV